MQAEEDTLYMHYNSFTCVISPVYSTIVPAMKVKDTEDHWKDSMNATHQCG